jgi:hypothetical protein
MQKKKRIKKRKKTSAHHNFLGRVATAAEFRSHCESQRYPLSENRLSLNSLACTLEEQQTEN